MSYRTAISLMIGLVCLAGASYADEAEGQFSSHQPSVGKPDAKAEQHKYDRGEIVRLIEGDEGNVPTAASNKSDEDININRRIAKYTKQLARYTQFLVIATAILSIAGIIQIALLGRSLKDSRVASIAAKRSADAIIDIDRAILFVRRIRKVRTDVGPIISKLSSPFKITVDFINHGKTPAIVKEISDEPICLESLPEIPEYKSENSSVGEFIINKDCCSHERINTISLTDTEIGELAVAAKMIFMMGFIRYEDIYGGEWVRGYAMRYDLLTGGFVVEGGKHYNYNTRAEFAPKGTRNKLVDFKPVPDEG